MPDIFRRAPAAKRGPTHEGRFEGLDALHELGHVALDEPWGNGVSVVVVEGNIGVGKTSLARLMARDLRGHLIEDRIEENPFLDRFYEDMGAYSFQTQLVFLMNRYKQQLTLAQKELFSDLTIIDSRKFPEPSTGMQNGRMWIRRGIASRR